MIIGIDASRAYQTDKTGTEYYSFHVISEMLRLPEARGHLFVLFTRPNAELPTEIDGYNNVIVKKINFRYLWTQVGLAWSTWGKFSNHKFSNPPAGRAGSQIDVLWVPAHTLPILRRRSIRTVVTIHGIEYKWLPEYKNLLQRWYLPLSTIYASRSADKLISVSEFTAIQLQKELHTNAKKIKVIHEGVAYSSAPVSQYPGKTLEKYGIEDKKYILFVGSIQPRKNLEALIEAFSKIKNGLKLVIAGSVGWLADDILCTPSRYNVQEKVIFTGRISENEKWELYRGAQMYAQPSVTEGFGLPILEAMQAGTPVISSNGGALSEVVGGAGIVVPLGNSFVNELADTMEKLSIDTELQQKLVKLGKQRVLEFGWQKAAKLTLQTLSK